MFEAFKRRLSDEEKTDELLSAFLDGMLTAAERTELEARLIQEPALRRRLEGLRLTVGALRGLPQVELPRNFILSPSMVPRPKPPALPRRRRAWPVFGLATALATLLFLVVIAGDFLVVAPARQPEAVDIVAQERELPGLATSESGAQALTEAPEMAPAEAERPVQAEIEEEAVLAEVEVAPPEEAPMAGGEAELPAAAAEGLEPAPTMEVVQEPSELPEEAPPSRGVTVTVEVEAEVIVTPAPELPKAAPPVGEASPTVEVIVTPVPAEATAEPEGGLRLTVSPPAEAEVADSATAPPATGTPVPTPLPEAVAVAPVEQPPVVTGAKDVAEGVPLWLRVAEVGLGLVVLTLAALTWIVWRRGV